MIKLKNINFKKGKKINEDCFKGFEATHKTDLLFRFLILMRGAVFGSLRHD